MAQRSRKLDIFQSHFVLEMRWDELTAFYENLRAEKGFYHHYLRHLTGVHCDENIITSFKSLAEQRKRIYSQGLGDTRAIL